MKKLLNVKGLRVLSRQEQQSIKGEGTAACVCQVISTPCKLNCIRPGICVTDHQGGLLCAPY
jgi:hypothetical protein